MHEDMEGYDWNEGAPDHEGEMAVTQLHRIVDMAEKLLDIVGEDDDLPGWIQYKIGRAYTDISDLFGYIEAEAHEHEGGMSEAKKKKGKCSGCKGKNPGLWCNICRKRARGEKPAKPGQKSYPKTLDIESVVRKTVRSLVEKELKGQ